MSDITFPIPAELPAQSLWRVALIAMLLAVVLVPALAFVPIQECRIVSGAFSSGFSLGFDVSREVCGRSQLATVMAHKVAGVLQVIR